MKTKKHRFNYKKHLMHVIAVGAMAVSFSAVASTSAYLHSHLRAHQARVKSVNNAPSAAKTAATPVQTTSTDQNTSLISAVTAKMGVDLVSIVNTKIDTNFIRKVEGSVLKGYVPLASTTNSGVTIADGFDLGQRKLAEFNKLPITAALKAKLQPYVGLTRFAAKDFVKAHPLTINEDELKQLNIVAGNMILRPLMKAYNKSGGKSFLELPAQAQTVIFSYAYQHGPGFMHKGAGKELWSYFVTQNWSKAKAALRSSKKYTGRRQQEASLLDHIV